MDMAHSRQRGRATRHIVAAGEAIAKDDQVIYRQKIRTGNMVDIGSVVSIEAGVATVHFPVKGFSRRIPVAELEKTAARFGGVRVHPSPARSLVKMFPH